MVRNNHIALPHDWLKQDLTVGCVHGGATLREAVSEGNERKLASVFRIRVVDVHLLLHRHGKYIAAGETTRLNVCDGRHVVLVLLLCQSENRRGKARVYPANE